MPGVGCDPPKARSARAEEVARLFDLDLTRTVDPAPCAAREARRLHRALMPNAHEITLLRGASGAGKSLLLRWMVGRRRCRRSVTNLDAMAFPDSPLVDCFGDIPIVDALKLLGRVGLGEAWSYLRTPAELSDGQRWRLRLAMGLHACGAGRWPDDDAVVPDGADAPVRHRRPPSQVLIADEFANPLDRITARIIAHTLRKLIDARPLAAIIATSHDDLADALRPERIALCDFGVVKVQRPHGRGSVRG